MIRDLGVTKSSDKLLTSFHKEWNLLDESVQVADQGKRHLGFISFFTCQYGPHFCHNVSSRFKTIGIDWRLFIDCSSRDPKAFLLHNPSLPMAHLVPHKEKYNSGKTSLDALKYDEYSWEVTGGFKQVAFLIGLQGGFTKFSCYLRHWDNRNTAGHYRRRDWLQRTEFSEGRNNAKWEPLVDSPYGADATTTHKIGPYETISHGSR